MSVVYSAVHVSLKTRHAIKVFDVKACADASILRGKFLAEARILAALRHPNIMRVTDYGTTEDGCPWLAMDFMEGMTLAERLAESIPPTHIESLTLYHDIRAALSHCHSRGIVHGDIKAENILLYKDGHAVLSDFGISRVINAKIRTRLELTSSCEAGGFGTAYALAPECRAGSPATPCSDVYSFGVVMFKVITGIWYDGSERLLGHLKAFAPEWFKTLEWMLARDPMCRPATAKELPDDPLGGCRLNRCTKLAFTAAMACAFLGGLMAWAHLEPGSHDVHAASLQHVESCVHMVLRAGQKAVMSGAVHVGRLSLSDVDNVVSIEIPCNFSGTLLTADEVDGVLQEQIRIVPQSGMRVIYRGNKEIVVKRQ